MIVLDAHAVLAYIKDEQGADQVESLLTQGHLTPTGVAEVMDHLVRVLGLDEDEAAVELATLDLPDAPPLDGDIMVRVGLLRARHYHRRERPVSLADCVAAEAARSEGAGLATADPDLLDLCHEEGIDVHPLPDSNGRVWAPVS